MRRTNGISPRGKQDICASVRVPGRTLLQEATRPMFFFFSNRLGCAGSLLLTLGGSLVLLFLTGLLSF